MDLKKKFDVLLDLNPHFVPFGEMFHKEINITASCNLLEDVAIAYLCKKS